MLNQFIQKLKVRFPKMAWVILEHQVYYHSYNDFAGNFKVDSAWKALRDITDQEYDFKLGLLYEVADILGLQASSSITFESSRPSVNLVLKNFSSKPASSVHWPDDIQQILNLYWLEVHGKIIYQKKRA